MPEQRDVTRPASGLLPLPSRRDLLSADKEELVERLQSLHRELQRRLEIEEEILHLNFQKGTASLQAQVEDASRRFRAAQVELEAFRAEILGFEEPSKIIPRPFVYEDFGAPAERSADPGALRSLLTIYRRLRDDRDGFRDEVERLRGDVERLRGELQEEQARAARAVADVEALRAGSAQGDTDAARLREEAEQLRRELADERAKAASQELESSEPAPKQDDAAIAETERLRRDFDVERERSEALARQLAEAQDAKEGIETDFERLKQDAERVRTEAEMLRQDLDGERAKGSKSVEDATALQAAKDSLAADHERIRQELAQSQAESSALRMEMSQVNEALSLERETSGRNSSDATQLREKLTELEGRLAEATKPPAPTPAEIDGHAELQKFLQKIRLSSILEKLVPGSAKEGQHAASELVYEVLVATLGSQDRPPAGAKDLPYRIVRPAKTPELGELRQFIEKLPESALRGFRRVQDQVLASLYPATKKQDPIVVDIESFELVFGSKPGAYQSYWPLVCYVPETREFWNGELGNEQLASPKTAVDFVSDCLSRVPSTISKNRLRFRFEAYGYGEPVVQLLDGKRCSYVIPIPDLPELRTAARVCAYRPLGDGWEASEFQGRLGPVRSVRAVLLRHSREIPARADVPFAFRDPQFTYYAFACDKSLTPRQALDCSAARPASEEVLHALLRDFATNKLLGRGAKAHAASFQFYLFASNLLQWLPRP